MLKKIFSIILYAVSVIFAIIGLGGIFASIDTSDGRIGSIILTIVIFIISAAFFALARILNKKSKELKIVEKSDSDKTIASQQSNDTTKKIEKPIKPVPETKQPDTPSSNDLEKLKKLKNAFDLELITEEEYIKKKQEILDKSLQTDTPSSNDLGKLEKLKNAFDLELITEEEYIKKKQETLDKSLQTDTPSSNDLKKLKKLKNGGEIEDNKRNQTKKNGINTTEEELEGFSIVKKIVGEIIDSERIFHRDTKSYMSVILDDNNRKPICRLWFNSSKKYIGIMGKNKKEKKELLYSLNDIYKFTDRLKDAAKLYV